jgi:hypothetical protein
VSAAPTLDELTIADAPADWRRIGFSVDDGQLAIGATRVRLAGREAGRGIVSWSLRDLAGTELDGLPTARSQAPPPEPGAHPNGALTIDHVVVSTPDFERTRGALEGAGIALRRERALDRGQGRLRMGFFRIGEAILELVEHPDAPDRAAPAGFWGLVVVVEDLEAAAAVLGSRLGEARDAVQPGRRIATVRPSAGLSPALALMSPQPRSAPRAR